MSTSFATLAAPLPRPVTFHEVVPRDGLQSAARFVPTEQKIELINRLSHTGLDKIEVTSFVSPKAVPLLADADQVMRGIERVPGVVYVALIANAQGAERALNCATDEVNLVCSVSEAHNQANTRRSTEASFTSFAEILKVLHGSGTRVAGSLSTSFGCPFEGAVPRERLFAFVERYLAMGVDSIVLADTTGMAHPGQVAEICAELRRRWPDYPFTLHFHNTRGMGLANVLAGLQQGITAFEGCLGGLGGCPFAPGATGNICSEDAIHMLQHLGHLPHVDLAALIDAARGLQTLLGQELPGQVMKAGMVPRG